MGSHVVAARMAVLVIVLAVVGPTAGRGQEAPTADEIKALLKEAEGLQKEGQAAKAVPILERALEATRKRFGEETASTAMAMSLMAAAYRQAGQSAKAEPLLRRCLEIREVKLGKDHLDTAKTLNDLGLLYKFLGRSKDAEPLYRRSLEIYEAKSGKDHLSTAAVVFNLADLCKSSSRYAEAEPLFRRSLAIREAKQGADHPDTATCLHSLANVYVSMARLAEAEPLFRRSLEIREAKLGTEHRLTDESRDGLGTLYSRSGKYGEAEALYRRTLENREVKAGKDHTSTAQSLATLGDLYRAMGRYDDAERLLQRALAIREAKLGKEHPTTATTLYELAYLYETMGRYAEEEQLLRRSLAIREAKGKDSLAAALVLNRLGEVYQITGRYGDAEPLHRRSLAIYTAKLGKDHPSTGATLSYLAGLYRKVGRHREAEPIYRRCLEISEAKLGKDHPHTATSLGNLAAVQMYLRRYQQAEPLLRRSLEIRESKLGKDHRDVSHSLQALGRLYRLTERAGEAEPLLRRSLEIQETKLGADHPGTANALVDLAMLKIALSHEEEAEPLYRRSLEIREAKLGKDHPTTIWSLNDLAALYASTDRPAEARAMFDRARRATRRYVIDLLPTLSEKEQRSYLISQSGGSSMALSMALKHGPKDPAIAEAGAAWLANSKAVQHEVQALGTQLQEKDDPEARPVATRLRKVRQALAKLRLEPAKEGLEAARRRQIGLLEAEDRQLTAQLRKLGGRTGRGTDWFELEALRRSLPERGVLIDIARHGIYDFQKSGKHKWNAAHYVAWVTPRDGAVRVVDLGEAAAIDSLVAAVQKELPTAAATVRDQGEGEAEKVLLAKTRALAQKVLDPLLELEEVKHAPQWVLSPDGNLWLVPWAALPLPSNGATRYVVERHLLRFVTAGRDVAGGIERAAGLKTSAPLIVADPDFDLGRSEAARLAQQTVGSGSNEQTRSLLSDGLRLGGVRRLPGTAAEAELIAPRIEELFQRAPQVHTGARAMEAVLKAVRRPQMLVLSTHGFFLAEQDLKQQAEADTRGVDNDQSSLALLRKDGKLFEEPLLRCGLLLAACNDQPKPGETRPGDDGVLTGLEVMGLDLRGCELVVLSACETGLGDVRSGEGVAGLRQAFQLAGAESVLSSLWKVPDRETAQLMIGFFEKLSAGKDRATALAQTQRELIRRHRQKNEAAHPFFWAAFTLTGQDAHAR